MAVGRQFAVEFRHIPGYGHTTVVGAVLPNVVDWLLRQPSIGPPTKRRMRSSSADRPAA